VFAYKTAVAIKNLGFTNIKIYNGGISDWKKAGYGLDVLEALPEYRSSFISAEELLAKIRDAESKDCVDQEGKPLLTIVDYRTETTIDTEAPVRPIETQCNTVVCLLDDLKNPEVRDRIPRQGLVVLVCETGMRDEHAMRYLFKHGYTNVVGLEFGMRAWIKLNYPVDDRK
jgi:rhodanese-related sulfurtransferase